MREIAAIDSTEINQLAEKNAPTIDDIRRSKELSAGSDNPRQIGEPAPMYTRPKTLDESSSQHLEGRSNFDVRERYNLNLQNEREKGFSHIHQKRKFSTNLLRNVQQSGFGTKN